MGAHSQPGRRQDSPKPAAVPTEHDEDLPGVSRRGALRKAAGISAVGIASGIALTSFAGSANAAPASPATPSVPWNQKASGPVVAHLADARTGAVDLFVGERHVRVHDQVLAQALAHAAAAGS